MKKMLLIAVAIALLLTGLTVRNILSPHDFFPPNRELSQILLSEPLSTCPYLYYGTSIVVNESSYNRLVSTIFNDTEHDIAMDIVYRIEFFDGQYWWWITPASAFRSINDWVPSFNSRTFTHNFYYTVDNLPPGHYRIRRRVFKFDEPWGSRRNYHDLVAEFWIE